MHGKESNSFLFYHTFSPQKREVFSVLFAPAGWEATFRSGLYGKEKQSAFGGLLFCMET
jgi:hypothetical protein